MAVQTKILLIGFGNPGRADDGLGPAAAEYFEKKNLPGVTVECDYQLTVEDCAAAAQNDIVIFVDASVNCREPFVFEPLKPKESGSFSSHSVEPAEVLALAKKLFNSNVKGFVLGIRGYTFDMFEEKMTEKAGYNLQKAVEFLENILTTKDFSKFVSCA